MADRPHVVIIGAGVGGLTAAVDLAARGAAVTVLEAASEPGGKMRRVAVGGCSIDAGPTVLTLPDVFEALCADAGTRLADHVTLRPAEVLARHAWDGGGRLDLFADVERSAAAVAALAGQAEATRFRRFVADARRMFETLDHSYIRAGRPTVPGLVAKAGVRALMGIKPFSSLWGALGSYFRDPRLRQLYGRYATYTGSSPFLAPATLMLIAHVEQKGVWLVDGGMHALAQALRRVAEGLEAEVRTGAAVAEITVAGGRAAGVVLVDGSRVRADAVVCNADAAALAAGAFGRAVAGVVPPLRPAERSHSALTFSMVAAAQGFPLSHHTVFFSGDYAAEFEDTVTRRRLPRTPTVYVCAQDRDASAAPAAPAGAERLFLIVNAPATGDTHSFPPEEIEQCKQHTLALMARQGLSLRIEDCRATSPADWERLFPATGGALYGRAQHGWTASFSRPGARTRVPGLYLAGGSAHPGAGVPMAALSGRSAAACLASDLASTHRFRATATSGGTWMR